MYIPWGKTLSIVTVKVICRGQISRSGHSFRKKTAIAGALVFHKHSLFHKIFSGVFSMSVLKTQDCVI